MHCKGEKFGKYTLKKGLVLTNFVTVIFSSSNKAVFEIISWIDEFYFRLMEINIEMTSVAKMERYS